MQPRPQRDTPVTAVVVAILGAAATMISPITPWTLGIAMAGALAVVAASAVLIVWLVRRQ